MRVKRILINDYRAFPGPTDYEFMIDGKNLLLYGENGSGKSSIYHALKDYFNNTNKAPAFSLNKNVFSKSSAGRALLTGKISIEFDDGSGLHTWDIQNNIRPSSKQYTNSLLRFGSIDYRAMLRTNIMCGDGTPNLYKLLVDDLLSRMPIGATPKPTNGDLVKMLRLVDDSKRIDYDRRDFTAARMLYLNIQKEIASLEAKTHNRDSVVLGAGKPMAASISSFIAIILICAAIIRSLFSALLS